MRKMRELSLSRDVQASRMRTRKKNTVLMGAHHNFAGPRVKSYAMAIWPSLAPIYGHGYPGWGIVWPMDMVASSPRPQASPSARAQINYFSSVHYFACDQYFSCIHHIYI